MSLAALLYRAQDAGLISANTYQSALKYMSRAGWRKAEPGELGAPERPRLLRRAMKALEESGMGIERLADLAHIPVEVVQVYVTVPGSTGRVAVDF
jgi:Zn-dependent peptidase ImmA (M78 family)